MESRMERYHKDNLQGFKRTEKNAKLYRDISEEISQLDSLPVSENANVIDMEGLKKIISSRSDYQKAKNLKQNTQQKEEVISEEKRAKRDERIYDINVLLEQAKKEIEREHSIRDKRINSNFLIQMEDANIPKNDDAKDLAELEVKREDKKVSSTDSLPLDILTDLKGNDNTVVTDPIIKDEVTMIKKIKDRETFYSGSYTFSKKDFADEIDDSFIDEKKHTGVRVLFLLVGLLLLIGAIYFILAKYVLAK